MLKYSTYTQVEQQTNLNDRIILEKAHLTLLEESSPSLGIVHKRPVNSTPKAAVILVHGFAQNRYTWHGTKRSFSAWLVSKGFEVYNLELRGHGNSRRDGQVGAECFADYVDDVIRAAQAIPNPAFWIGHSLGGAAIYGAAATMTPLKCLGVIGLGAVFHFGKGNFTMKTLCRISHKLRHIPVIEQLQVKTRLGGGFLSNIYGITDILGYTFPLSGWWPGSIEPDILQERLQKGFDWTSVKVWLEMSRWGATGRFDYEEQWQKTMVPLLVVLGDEDHLLTPESGRVAFDTSPSQSKELLLLDDFFHEQHWGHLDITIGHRAPSIVWPALEDWMLKVRNQIHQ